VKDPPRLIDLLSAGAFAKSWSPMNVGFFTVDSWFGIG
jgi:hypothetical protein